MHRRNNGDSRICLHIYLASMHYFVRRPTRKRHQLPASLTRSKLTPLIREFKLKLFGTLVAIVSSGCRARIINFLFCGDAAGGIL